MSQTIMASDRPMDPDIHRSEAEDQYMQWLDRGHDDVAAAYQWANQNLRQVDAEELSILADMRDRLAQFRDRIRKGRAEISLGNAAAEIRFDPNAGAATFDPTPFRSGREGTD